MRRVERVRADTGDEAVLFDEVNDLAEQVDVAVFEEFIAGHTLREGGDGAVVDGHLHIFLKIRFLRIGLGEPLDFAASFLPVFFQESDGVLVGTQNGGVDAVLLAKLEGLHDFVVGEIMPHQRGDINEVSAVGNDRL